MYKVFFKECFERIILGFFIALQNFVKAELDKTETLMNLKNNAINGKRILSRNIEC